MRWLAVIAALAGSGCLDQLQDRTAFAGLRYLCASEHAPEWERQIAACREVRARGARCGGVFSMQGRLQDIDVMVETPLQATILYAAAFDSGELLLNRLYLNGWSPYFFFVLKAYTVGGNLVDPNGVPRELAWDPAALAATASLETLSDARVGGDFRIETSVDDVALPVIRDSGTMTIRFASQDEIAAEFTASFGDAHSSVSGCFHAFATQTRIEDQ